MSWKTLLYEVDAEHVATITLNRPEALNSFNRLMCDEFREVWKQVREDDAVHAVVLRAAPGRAFCTGIDVKSPYGQPDDIWNHEDPGEPLSPKWNHCWKPVVCAVHGICTAGAFYFLNEADIVICSSDAQFFDSHVSTGRVAVLEPIGLSRRIHLGDVLRIALLGNDERITAETALRIGIVSEVTSPEELWKRAHELAAAIARKPSVATQGTVKAIWESLDKGRQAALDQGLAYTRLANPIGEKQADQLAKTGKLPFRLR
jgi:enoyl-CoA hydratase/carnithine racemase